MFNQEFASSDYEVRDIRELGRDKVTTQLTYTLRDSGKPQRPGTLLTSASLCR